METELKRAQASLADVGAEKPWDYFYNGGVGGTLFLLQAQAALNQSCCALPLLVSSLTGTSE